MNYTEKQLIAPALYLIDTYPGIKMDVLIKKMEKAMKPTGKDATILAGRGDTYFSQKVRNLKSHRDNNKMAEYTDLTPSGEYFITDKGKKALEDDYAAMQALFSFDCDDDTLDKVTKTRLSKSSKKVTIFAEDDLISEGKAYTRSVKAIERSAKLRKFAVQRQQSIGDFSCAICGFNFEKEYGELGKDYIQFHHIKPLSEYTDAELNDQALKDAVANLIPLCPNCHCMVHKCKEPDPVAFIKALRKK